MFGSSKKRILRILTGICTLIIVLVIAGYAYHPYPSTLLTYGLWPKFLPIFWPDEYVRDDPEPTWNPDESPWEGDPQANASMSYMGQLRKESKLYQHLHDFNYEIYELSEAYRGSPESWPESEAFWDLWHNLPDIHEFVSEGEEFSTLWQNYNEQDISGIDALFLLNELYQIYLLELAKNDVQSFCDASTEYFCWLMKGKRGAQSIFQHLAWLNCIDSFNRTTTICICNYDFEQHQLEMLFQALPDLGIKQLGLRRGFEVEYIFQRNIILSDEALNTLSQAPSFPIPIKNESDNRLLFLRNRTLNKLAGVYQETAERVEKGELSLLSLPPEDVLNNNALTTPINNLIGKMFMFSAPLLGNHLGKETWEYTIRYQLLRKELSNRLGYDMIILDPLTNGPFGRSLEGLPFSAGLDRVPDTEDDIFLTPTHD